MQNENRLNYWYYIKPKCKIWYARDIFPVLNNAANVSKNTYFPFISK